MDATKYQLITTAEELRVAVEELSKHQAIGFDTETTSLDPYQGRLRLVQLAAPDGVRIIDLDRFTGGEPGQTEALAPLRSLLAALRPVKIAHNAKFDAKWIKHTLGVELGGLFDTLLASQIVAAGDQEERHGLEAVAARHLGETIDKAERLSDWSGELSESQLQYAALDASVLLPLREKLIERLKADALLRCAALEFECVLPVAAIELAGIYLDQHRWREQLVSVEKKRTILANELQEMLSEESMQGSLFGPPTRDEINLDSHTQLTKALKRLGVPVPDSTRNWKLQPLAAEYEVVKKLLEYRTVQKALTSYGENILDEISPVTGRIHADFRQIGAPTGRMACLTGETYVATLLGFKRMDTIKQGDLVKTSYGFKRVKKAWLTGVRQVYRVQLKDGRSIRASRDHQFLSGRGDEWKKLYELNPGDHLYVSLKNIETGEEKKALHLGIVLPEFRSRKAVTLPEILSFELCELMGLIVADGFLGKRYERSVTRRRLSGLPAQHDRVYLAFGWKDKEVVERVVAHSLKLFGQPFVEVKSKTCRVFQLASTKVAEFLSALGLTGNAHTKSVPEIILRAPAPYQASFLRGLFEGDGHRIPNSIGLTSVNRHLLSQVQMMLSNMGMYSIIRARHDVSGFSGAERFTLSISKKSDLVRFMEQVSFISDRKSQPCCFSPKITDGIATPFKVMGALLYREAVMAGTTEASRVGIKPFAHFYRDSFIKGESVEKLIKRFGPLPSLEPVSRYLDLEIRPVEIESIIPDGAERVYDISVEDVHEFVANGIVVHNCTNPNIQQVPHAIEYRRCFRAPEGRKLIISDFSQIELRILADFTQDQGFIDAFNSGADLHRVTAAQVFGVPLDKVTKEQRDFAKRLNFGVVYGIGAQRFSMMTGLSLTEAEDILRRYFATYRQLDNWLRDAARQAIRERTAPRTVAGRLARFRFDPEDRQAASLAQRNGKNSPIQGCVNAGTRVFEKTRGYVPIETLVGEKVCVWDGSGFSNALVASSGRKRLVKITLWGGHDIECSPDHKFWTFDANGRGRWLRAEEIAHLKQIYVALAAPVPGWELPLDLKVFEPLDLKLRHQPIAKPHNAKALSLELIDDRFDLGLWLGRLASDGCISSLDTIGDSKIYGRAARVHSVEITDKWVEMYDVIDSASERFAANGLITHNSSADILKRALRLLHDQLRDTTACIVNIVHDEIVVEADANQAAEIAEKVEDAMCAAGKEYVKRVPVKVETEVADEWVK